MGRGFGRAEAGGAKPHNRVQYALRHLELAALRDLERILGGDDRDGVAVGVEADARLGDVVHHDGVDVLGGKLSAGIVDDVLGFGGEADQNLAVEAVSAELGENIGGRLQLQGQRTAGALDLFRSRLARPIVGDRSSFLWIFKKGLLVLLAGRQVINRIDFSKTTRLNKTH